LGSLLISAHGNQKDFDLQIHFFQNLFPSQNIGKSRQMFTRRFTSNIPEDNHLLAIKSLPSNIFGEKGLVATRQFVANIPSKDHLAVAR